MEFKLVNTVSQITNRSHATKNDEYYKQHITIPLLQILYMQPALCVPGQNCDFPYIIAAISC